MEVKRFKRYKAKSPNETINEIRNTLHKLGILMKEEHFKDKDSMFYSCSIFICNEGLDEYNLGCNGKGMTAEYALASAYGEFMERLQNNLIFMHQDFAKSKFLSQLKENQPFFYNKIHDENLLLNYNFAPDESYTKSSTENKEIINQFITNPDTYYNGLLEDEKLTLLPFFNVFEEKIEKLPIELIIHNCTSNGMSAGNTPKEALIQGLSEIFERYAIRLIYKENLSLPSIPKEYFKGTKIYENIIHLEKENGWEIDIKDCSCGKKIPAIGVLIHDKINIKHQFHIGVDPSPITALERSLTEIYQGRTDVLFHEIDLAYQSRLMTDMDLKETEMFKTYVDSRGIYPISLFSKNYKYSFEGFNSDLGLSDDSDLNYMIETVKQLGFKMYIRNSSFLNFPAFHVYIPGMSEIKNVFSSTHFNRQYKKTRNYFLTAHNLPKASNTEIETLLEYIKWDEKNVNVMKFFNNKDGLLTKDTDLVLAVLNIKIGNNREAIKHIDKYIESIKTIEGITFFKCIKDILFVKDNNNKEFIELMNKIYSPEVIKNASSFIEEKNILDYFNFSSCFECDKCKIYSSCSFFNVLKIAKEVEVAFKNNILDQSMIPQYIN